MWLMTPQWAIGFSGPLCVFLSVSPPSSFPLHALTLFLCLSLSLSSTDLFCLWCVERRAVWVLRDRVSRREVCTIRDKIMAPRGLVWPCTRSIKRMLLVPRSTLMSICWGLILGTPHPSTSVSCSFFHMYAHTHIECVKIYKYLYSSEK